MIIAGIDGCKKGWIMVKYAQNEYSFGIYATLNELFDQHADIKKALIDMPVGLSSKTIKRTIDQALRSELKGRASTVFTPPCRAALAFLPNFEKTKLKNIEIEGKSLSIQSLNISNKILEVDDFLEHSSHQVELIESHPELCFKYLNEQKVVLSKKSTAEGQQERLNILTKYDAAVPKLYASILNQTLRKNAKADDVMDAISLCLVNKLGLSNGLSFVTGSHLKDEKGIPLRVAYFKG